MPRFSRKEQAICNSCGNWGTTDFTPEELQEREWECSECMNKRLTHPEDLPENRGQKEISKYSPEYDFLKRLINLVVKEGVPPQEIKAITLSHPFQTIDDLGDLTAKIWTLATEKYHIPREWLIKKLPEKRIKSDLRDENWPAQRNTTYFGMRPWNETAYESWKNTEASEEKEASPETDHQLYLAMGEDTIKEMFFEKGIRFSKVIEILKEQVPQLTDEDIANLKTDTKYKLEQYKIQIDSKKKGLSLDKVLQILEQKGPKPTNIDYTDLSIEFLDGSKLSFDEATRKALDLNKSSSEASEEQERNKDSGTGFYDSPNGYQFGKRPQGDESIWPSDTWLPRGTEEEESQTWDNIAASKKFSKKEIKAIQVSSYWASPKGEIFKTPDHADFALKNNTTSDELSKSGWIRAMLVGDRLVLLVRTLDDLRSNDSIVYEFLPKLSKIDVGDLKGLGLASISAKDFKKHGWDALSKGASLKKAFLKISKPESGYVDNGKGYTCGRCAYFKDGKCALVQGEIKAQGCCNYWDDKAQLKQEGPGYTKAESGYIEYPNVDYRCDECIFFDPKAKTCTKVEGEISPTASCNLWQPISKKQSSLNKKADTEGYWIQPNGEIIDVTETTHDEWLLENKEYDDLPTSVEDAIKHGWIRVMTVSGQASFNIDSLNNPPKILDDLAYKFTSKRWVVADAIGAFVIIDNPTKSFTEEVTRAARKQVRSFSKKELNKVANPPSRFWIAPDGKEFRVGSGGHGIWIKQNKELLNNYGVNTSTVGYTWPDMINKGWTRVATEWEGSRNDRFGLQVADLTNLPNYLDNFISKYYRKGENIEIGDLKDRLVIIEDPFPSVQKAVNKALRNPVNAMLKKADVSGKQINDILKLIESSGGATYNLSQGNLVGQNAFAVSIYPDREKIVDLVDYDTLEGYLVDNQDLLNDPKNSFGAWTSNGKVYLDTIITVPTKEEALQLAHKHNQLAVFDLAQMKEIPVGLPAMSKKELNIVKKAEESVLPQNVQDEIAAKYSPAMNILLNNYIEAKSRGHDKERSFQYAYESIQNLDTNITEKQAMEAINTYTIGLA